MEKKVEQKVEEKSFDMRSVMLRFLSEIVEIFLSSSRLRDYLQFTPTHFSHADDDSLDSDDEPVNLSKFIPKSEKKEKIIERKNIPRYYFFVPL